MYWPPYGYPQLIIGDEIDDSIDRLHADIMAFGQALYDLLFVPGTWVPRPGVQTSDRYHFYVSMWDPFNRAWQSFRSLKRDVPMQTLPGSGTAGELRAYRAHFAQIVQQARRDWILSGTGYIPPPWALRGQ